MSASLGPLPKLVSVLICIAIAWGTLYRYIEKQNELTELRLAIPALSKEVKALHEENQRLKYEIDQFESPIHLMELARKPEFSHLKYPTVREIVVLEEPPEHAPHPAP
jgi:hypothetical protein